MPALLTSVRDADQLIRLAFDLRVPAGASQVSTRDIRLARITAAIALAGELGRRDDLFKLLLEASLVAAGHQRSDRFLYEHPDLAAIAADPEALRRLAVTNVGWPGGKHSALALANAFAGDHDEARRHARRSIDWHNWAAQSRRGTWFNTANISREWDDVGFAYVEMLAGNDIRVAEFFGRREDDISFSKFGKLFDLLERHETTTHAPSARVISRLTGCRLQSRALFAAAMQFTKRDNARDKKILRAMAGAPPVTGQGEGLTMAIVLAAARAADLGLSDEGISLIEGAGLKTQSIHDYSSYYQIDRTIDQTIVAAGVRSVLRRKPATLVDIAPSELIALVPRSARARGAAAFSRALAQKLSEPKHDGTRRRRKRRGALDGEKRSDYSRALSNRIMPLLQYAQDIASIIRPPSGRTRSEMVNSAFDRLVADVERSSNYPYRDGKAYLARTGFRAIFHVSDALEAIDPVLAKRMVDWLTGAPGLFTPELTEAVARLSRAAEHHFAALTLAGHVEQKIQLDTDVGSRVAAYGQLARAVWRVSTDEAAAYFRRALDLTEAIGSDDFDLTNHLLDLTSHYSGPELPSEAAHTLARILELNQGEDGRFPWIEYAQTMVPIAGRGVLAILARLDDRDVARLRLSLGPALTVLVRQSKIAPATAAALFGLAPPGEAWTWHISDFASEVIKGLSPDQYEWFFNMLLIEIDREDQLTPARKTIEGLHRLAVQALPPKSASRSRIEGLLARRGEETEALSSPSFAAADPDPFPVFSVDLSDPDQIDRQILNEEVDKTGWRWPVRTLLDLAKQASSPAERLGFVRAVVEASNATLADKVMALEDYVEEWATTSAAMRDALPVLSLHLASKHAAELASSSTDAQGAWRRLEKCFMADRVALVEHVVASLRGVAHHLGGNAWLALAARLAADVSDQTIADSLERFLARSAEKLPTEVGDGPWTDRLSTPNDEAELIAGLVWARLGHPVAAMRWRAAHAVRRLAHVGRFDVIHLLIGRFGSNVGLPFCDAKLPFYMMHAQLWLLIALARVSRDDPERLIQHRSFFYRIALSSDFPHVVMRSFAMKALQEIARIIDPSEGAALLGALSTVNVSPYPHAPRQDYRDFRYLTRPETSPHPADAFHLDYNFNKYQVERLCHVFACPGWEVEDRISSWVRRWDSNVSAMHECPRSSNYDESWSSGYVPERDPYGGYLGWHALMLVAGDLLASRQVVGEDWSGDAWAAFLNEYLLSREDGLWLADLTDPYPLALAKGSDVSMPESSDSRSAIREDAKVLAPLLGISDGKLAAEWTPISGLWSIARDTTLTLVSVLADQNDVRSAAMTLLSDDPSFRWMPDDEDEIDRHLGKKGHSIQPWVAKTPNPQRQLDRHDHYGCTSALDRPFPADLTKNALGIFPTDAAVREWSSAAGPQFYAEAWGAEGGRGEQEWSESGSRLSVRTPALKLLLGTTNRNLLILLKIQRYHRSKSTGRRSDTSRFTYRSLIAIVNRRGQVWLPQRLSSKAKLALDTLDANCRRDFYSRFRAIAGLPDERLARGKSTSIDVERFRILIEEVKADSANP